MHANPSFQNRDTQFWAHVRLISERLKYSTRAAKGQDYNETRVKKYDYDSIIDKFNELGVHINTSIINDVLNYLDYRADTLNDFVRPNLMMAPEAEEIYDRLKRQVYENHKLDYSPAFNKQTGEKSKPAYYTGIIDYLTLITLYNNGLDKSYYNNNPNQLVFNTNNKNELTAVFSRRFDGAYPSLINPKIIWEIKEYYYTTTFGSKISDGVYETQLDGFEINQVEKQLSTPIHHVFFTDAEYTWWKQGKPYLCRLFDALHMGLIDELIIGREVIDRWPILLREFL